MEEESDPTKAALDALRSLEIETEDDGHDLNSALSSLLASGDADESDHNVYYDDDVFDTDESVSDLQDDEDALDLASLLADSPEGGR